MRDHFSAKTKRVIAARVGYRCCNPDCRGWTSGPTADDHRAFNLGVAAHITAASPGGPRYDKKLTEEQRRSAWNGLWLCQSCAKLIDNDEKAHPMEVLHRWKKEAEQNAADNLQRRFLQDREVFAYVSKAERFGIESCVLKEGVRIPYAIIIDPDDPQDPLDPMMTVNYYASPAYVVRFLVQKNEAYDHVLVNEVFCTVHQREDLTEFQRLPCAYPYETNLYLVEIAEPPTEKALRCVASRYYPMNRERANVAQTYSPLLLKESIPETIDVRVNARRQGLYLIEMGIVISHGVNTETVSVLEPTRVLFDQPERNLIL